MDFAQANRTTAYIYRECSPRTDPGRGPSDGAIAESHEAHTRADVSPSALRDLATAPSGRAARRQDELLLAEALERLPRSTRLILELAYWEELDGAAIAQVLEVPLNTAYSLLRRAKLSLRGRLEELAPDHRRHVAHALAALETQA